MVEKKRRLEAICAAHGVPLKAAALQFPLRHRAITCVVSGARTATEVRENVAMMSTDIPASLWDALTEEIDG